MVVDIIIVGLLALEMFDGYKKGLVGVLVSFASIILSILFAFILQAPLADYIANDTSIGTTLTQTIQTNLEDIARQNAETPDSNKTNTFYDTILNSITNGAKDTLTSNESAKLITNFILKGLSFVGVFVIVFIICFILQMILNLVFDLPILSSINKLGGIGIGAIKSFIKISIFLAVLSFIAPMPFAAKAVEIVQNSIVGNWIYTNNIIVSIIQSGLKIKV
ncbi:MAG: CvpA family protein [Clostridia bacterium]